MTGGKLILAAALLWALSCPVGADLVANSDTDTTYSGALDTRTGLPAGSRTGETGEEDEKVKLLGDGSYGFDLEQQMFVSYVGRSAFYSSVPPGIVLSSGQEVSFRLPSGVTGTLYKDGDPLDGAELSQISGSGSYVLQVQGSGAYDTYPFRFTILEELTGTLVDYTLPGGFAFDSVTINGEAVTPEYANYVQFLEEGDFQLHYSCPDIGRSYTLTLTVDRTPPVLALPEVTDGEAHGAVSLADLEPGAWIQVEHNGESSRVTSPKTVLSEAGRYVLTVYDQAGNSSQYVFTIHVYLNLSAVAAIGLAVLGCCLVVLYSRWVRGHARVG